MSRKSPPPITEAQVRFGAFHDDTLLGATRTAQFLGLPNSTFYALRERLGRDFPRPVLAIGRPRYRVGSLRAWLRQMERGNTESAP